MVLLFDYLVTCHSLKSVLRSYFSGMLSKSLEKTCERVKYLIELPSVDLQYY